MKLALLLLMCFLNIKSYSRNTDTFQVLFPLNNAKLSKVASRSIDSIIYQNRTLIKQKLIILGYTDYLGNDKDNNSLSLLRAKNVAHYLVIKGYNTKDIILCIGKGKIDRTHDYGSGGYADDRKVQIIVDKPKPTGMPAKIDPTAHYDKNNRLDLDKSALMINEVIPLKHILFEMSTSTITDSSYVELIILSGFLQKHKNIRIQIEGHECCNYFHSKSDTSIDGISYRRAKSIYDFLALNKIEKDRLSVKGLGFLQPIAAPERTIADEALNRCVAIRILKK